MKGSTRIFALLGLAALPAVLCAQDITAMRDVTDERLQNPEPENWLMFRREYSGNGESCGYGGCACSQPDVGGHGRTAGI